MAKRVKKSARFIVAYLFLLLLIGICLYASYYFSNEAKKNKDAHTKLVNEISIYDKQIKEKDEAISGLDKDIDVYSNLDKTIEETRTNYFKELKQLEDDIIAGKSKRKIAYLTFDDGPYYNTYKVLNILDKYNIKATFFTTNINGEYCYDKKSENCWVIYKEYVKRGHTIANHTYTHAIYKGLYKSAASFIEAVTKQEEHVKTQTGGYVTNIVRFPGGSSTAGKKKSAIIEELRKKHYGWVDWNAQDGDGGKLDSKDQARSIFKSSINSNIEVVLFHDYSGITTSLLPEFIEYLQKNGYEMYPLFYDSNMVNK